ncbi:MAG: dihydroorotate dehydrogenase [Thermodesulfobacteriota bacterium]
MAVDLTVNIGAWQLANPIMTASGTFGYGEEFSDFVELDKLGAIVVKGISVEPRSGNPPPRVVETACGMLNAIGLENKGLAHFIDQKIPMLAQTGAAVVANILGDQVADYGEISGALDEQEVIRAIEVNISCPNVKKGGVAFGTQPAMAAKVTRAVRRATSKPVIVKLSPNVTDITEIARAVAHEGADGLSLINTLLGMAIDARSRRPKLANVVGGLSGPAIKPVALRMVYQVAQATDLPIIGIGGISTASDVVEFLIAGASAVQVGTANFINPGVSGQLVDELRNFLEQEGLDSVRELTGSLIT